MYKNKNTSEIVDIDKKEIAPNFPKSIVVYILSDGSRWEEELFLKNWIFVGETK